MGRGEGYHPAKRAKEDWSVVLGLKEVYLHAAGYPRPYSAIGG
jgi:hypothetical protein